MNGYDLYCQICNKNIYNTVCGWMFREHYECLYELSKGDKLESQYPQTRFRVDLENYKIKDIILKNNNLLADHTNKLKIHINNFFEGNGTFTHIFDGKVRENRKSIREMSAMSQIYRLMLRSGLSIEEISGRLTAMRKLHNETPNAKVNVLFLTQLSMDIMDKKSKK
jgi:hypothetical protein